MGMQVGVPEENAQEHKKTAREMRQAKIPNFKLRRDVDTLLKAESEAAGASAAAKVQKFR